MEAGREEADGPRKQMRAPRRSGSRLEAGGLGLLWGVAWPCRGACPPLGGDGATRPPWSVSPAMAGHGGGPALLWSGSPGAWRRDRAGCSRSPVNAGRVGRAGYVKCAGPAGPAEPAAPACQFRNPVMDESDGRDRHGWIRVIRDTRRILKAAESKMLFSLQAGPEIPEIAAVRLSLAS